MRVHQGGDDANLGEADPDRDIVRAILHAERNPVAGFQSVRQRPMGNPVRGGIEFGICGELAFKPKRDVPGMLVDTLLEIVRNELPGVRRNVADQLVHPDRHA